MSKREQLEQTIAALEAQRAILGDAVVDTAIVPLREKLNELEAPSTGKIHEEEQQRKQITVLFAEFSGFKAMSETMDVEEVGDTMNALWQRIDEAITAHGGLIDKHISNTVMALFGVPTAREDDPERAIRTALKIRTEAVAFCEKQQIDLAMRIGINTGAVILSNVGTTEEYTAMGDTVNLASRLEHAASPGQILISHDTYRHVRGVFDVQVLEPITVKGKKEPVQVYVVKGAKPHAFRIPTWEVEGLETHMVGRDAELKQLQNGLRKAIEEREAQMFTVVGEAGIGKSRLLSEFENWMDLLPQGVWLFKGRASQEMSKQPYSLFRDLFSFRFGILDSDQAEAAREKLVRGILEFMGADAEEKAHFIGHLIGFDFSESPYIHGILDDARQIRDRAFHSIAQFFAAVTRDGPAAIYLEDLHWADNGSLDLLDHLVRECRHIPLLTFGLTRPELFERRPSWGAAGGPLADVQTYLRLDLRPLSKHDTCVLIEVILQKLEEVPPDLRDLIVESAEGNPFYVEEVIKMLIEDGIIVKETERWRVKMDLLAELHVPPTLTSVLQARLDRLPLKERETLQQASVIGRIFWDGAVEWLYNAENGRTRQYEINAGLHSLKDKELIFGREPSTFLEEREYIFKHAILHDVTYESVLKRLRRVYHTKVAEWLVEKSGERVGEYAGLIGEHYKRAGKTVEAAGYLRRSGEELFKIGAFRDAVNTFERVLALLPAESSERTSLTIQVGEALMYLGDYRAASSRLEEGLALAHQHDDDVNYAASLNHLGMIAREQGAFDEARERLEASLILAQKIDDQTRIAHILHELGWVDFRQGAYSAARDRFGESRTLFQSLNDRRGLARTLNGIGAATLLLTEYEEAQSCLVECLALCRELGDRNAIARAINLLGEIARRQGDYATAQSYYQEALSIFKEIGVQQGVAALLDNLGHMVVAQGDYTAAESYYHEAIQVAMTIGAVPVALESLAGLAGIAAHVGQAQRALELIGLVLHHQSLDSDAKLIIKPILADLRAKLPPDVVETAMERGKSLELETIVAEILKEVSDD